MEKGTIKIDEVERGKGVIEFSCKSLKLSDGKIEIDMDETNIIDYKTWVVRVGEKKVTYKQV